MSWKIEIKPNAEKSYLKLNTRLRKRIKKGLRRLGQSANPLFTPDVRPLTGKLHGDFRLRVGGYRVLFTPDKENKIIQVYAILPRGKVY